MASVWDEEYVSTQRTNPHIDHTHFEWANNNLMKNQTNGLTCNLNLYTRPALDEIFYQSYMKLARRTMRNNRNLSGIFPEIGIFEDKICYLYSKWMPR